MCLSLCFSRVFALADRRSRFSSRARRSPRGTRCAASPPHRASAVTLSLQLSRLPVATAALSLSASSGVGDRLELHSPHSAQQEASTTDQGVAALARHLALITT
ncbi:hypothetical protein Scep_007088 [Stephania cephalantha]|uniref:Uncharacterized protein n=1 Tax=Stephania cephalantha TaxID=152367 RepID=A0AAP0PPN7_9MAGN